MGGLEEAEGAWRREAEAVLSGLKGWRLGHPRATFRELEAAVDERLNRLRARWLADLALVSRAAAVSAQPVRERPRCPGCGGRLAPRGRHERQVVVQGGQVVRLERDYAACPACGSGLFPPG